MNILLLTSHAIAEYDDLRMFTDLGYPVYSIGGAYDEVPFEGKRPALPNVVRYPDLEAATQAQRVRLEDELGSPDQRPNGGHHYIDWGKARLAPEVIDWADAIIVHHFPERWIGDQWEAISHKRVIWRTCGQSDPRLERQMQPFHEDGLEIVRYSPREEYAFTKAGAFAGQDAIIRFGKYPADYHPWKGDEPFYSGADVVVGNITQDMAKRGEACGLDRWNAITAPLPVMPAGPGSEDLRGGIGALDYEDMLAYLRRIRTYLYLGTQPAPYTLGLIEAMLSGVPVVPVTWTAPSIEMLWLDHLWEANDICGATGIPSMARIILKQYLDMPAVYAAERGEEMRQRAIHLFGIERVGAEWREFLG